MFRQEFNNLKKRLYDIKFFAEDFWRLNCGRNKLPAPSIREKKLIKELRQRMRTLKSSAAGKSWEDFVKKLKRYVLYLDPRNFLRWEVIRLTMTMTDTPPECLTEMKASPNWENLWQPALQENDFGQPVPHPNLEGSSGTLVIHAWHLFNLKKVTALDFSGLAVVIEFGGGYGSMCRLLRHLGFRGIYVIYDLPEFSLLQDFYLRGLGQPTVTEQELPPAPGQNILISNLEDFKRLNAAWPAGKKLFIATWSLSETPLEPREEFLSLVANGDYYLFAFQDKFDGVDNLEFFKNYQKKNNHLQWSSYLSYPRDQRDYYLIGYR